MRLAVYSDDRYVLRRGELYADRTFPLFAAELAASCERLSLIGRLAECATGAPHRIPPGIELVRLPDYASLADPAALAAAAPGMRRAFRRVLDEVDAVWVLGPHPAALALVLAALARRRTVVLGVRQDLVAYVRARYPGHVGAHVGARTLEGAWRALTRRLPVAAAGPELAARYGTSGRRLELRISLTREAEVVPAGGARPATGRRLLAVTRLDREKNPLLLADVLAELRRRDERWRLVVCGDGPLREALRRRLRALGVAEHAELRGYVPLEAGLGRLYRECDFLLHTSWTEGLPQVLFEAFAAGLPAVVTGVGGVSAVASGRALVVPPGDPRRAAAALARLADDAALRRRHTRAARELALRHTIERESARLASFIAAANRGELASRRRDPVAAAVAGIPTAAGSG